jgi:branched-chain amino acid transport system substrate-binding protein
MGLLQLRSSTQHPRAAGDTSPEQLRGAGAGPAGDVFSLGAVLVYAATGAGPFGGGAAQEVNFRAAYEPAQLAGVPDGLRGLVERCLEKDGERRPGVGELVAALADRAPAGQDPRRGLAGQGGLPDGLDWLPAPVARAVREQTESSLPATPPHSTPPPGTPPAAPPPAPHMAPMTGAFGPPLPVAPPPQPPTGQGTSRRRLLAIGGGAVTVAGLGVLGYVLTSGDGSDGGSTGGTTGGTTGGPSGEDTTIVRIAVQAPLSGPNEAIGQELLRAAELAVADANKEANAEAEAEANADTEGDAKTLRFEVLEADDQGEASQAIEAAQRAIDDERVVAVVGPAFSGTVNAAGPLYAQAGLACVTASATDPSLTQQDFGNFLRALPPDGQTARAIGDLLYDSPAITVLVIDDGSPYGTATADVVQSRVDEHILMTTTRRSTADASLDTIARDATDNFTNAVVFLGYHEDAARLAQLLGSRDYVGLRISGSGVMNQAFVESGGSATEGWYLVCPCYDAYATEAGRDFAHRFEEEYGAPPGWHAPRAYDVTRMITQAAAGLGQNADRGHVLAKLVVGSHTGITGTISFEGQGEYAGTGPSVYRVSNGVIEPRGLAEDLNIDDLD